MDSLSKQITLIIIASVFFIIVAIGIVILVLVYQKKQLHYLREKEQLKVTFEKEILGSKLEIQEQTFINISQEIHDNIGQVLSLVKLNINTMSDASPEALQDKINTSKHLITKAIQDLRDLSKSLNTDYITELGLIRSIEYELELIQKTGSHTVQFNIEGKTYRLEKQQELIFFRIVQEALHNIIRHAKATAIDVQLVFKPEIFTLKIADNGVGFDTSPQELNNYSTMGLGIRNMRNRANIINTDFKLMSTPEKGTTIILTLPLQKTKL
jgi:two-component system NarL family sensor kinase